MAALTTIAGSTTPFMGLLQQLGWGNAPGSFEDNIGSIFGSLGSYGGSLMGTYDNTFVPEINDLVAQAADYASPARIEQNMGRAEAGAAQAGDAARQNALSDLESFGVDPSSGRYADLDKASREQAAATEVGAGNVAEQETEAIARSLQAEAIQATANLPAYAATLSNAQTQNYSAQIQAELGQEGLEANL